MRPLIILFLSLTILIVFYLLAKTSLEGLKYEAKAYFPFDKYFPKYPIWSTIFYIILLGILSFLLYLFIQGKTIIFPTL